MQKKILVSIITVILIILFVIGIILLFSKDSIYPQDYLFSALLTILPAIGLLILLNNYTKK